jgi:hypothetical protein
MKRIYFIAIVVVFIILLVFFYAYFKCTMETINLDIPLRLPVYTLEEEKGKRIPKIIWTFWHSNHVPITIDKCIQSWRRTNPDYDIHIVTKDSLSFYLPDNTIFSYPHCKGKNNIQKASDFIRLQLIYKYGGFWIDASTILNGSLNYFLDIQQRNGYEYLGYYIDGFTKNQNFPVVENWFFAAVKDSRIIQLWNESFLKMNSFSTVEKYVQWVKNQGVDTQGIDNTTYLSMHVACQYMLQKMLTLQDIKQYMYLEKAEDGPFKYLAKNNWNSWTALHDACKQKDLQTLVFKMRGIERNIMQFDIRLLCIFDDDK